MPGKNQGELKEIYGSCFYCCEETFNSQKIKELLFGNRINIIKKGSRLICKVNEKQTNEFEIKELKILLEELKKEILEMIK